MNITSRKDALAQGLARYFTGKPCKHGHTGERHTVNGLCVQCNRERQIAYYAGHADERRAYQNAYHAKKLRS
jgi:hypothetical protein